MVTRITGVCLLRLPAKVALGNRFRDNQRHETGYWGDIPASTAPFLWTLEFDFGFGWGAKTARI
jgi:hypothetical protein